MKTKKDRTGFSDILKARRSPQDKHLKKAGLSLESFSDYTRRADIYRHKNVLCFTSPMEWEGKTVEEMTKHLVEVSDHCLDDPEFHTLVDPEFLKSWTGGDVNIEKSEEELRQDREFLVQLFGIPETGPWQKSLTLEERSELVHKSLEFVADKDPEGLLEFLKGTARGGKYLRKIPGPGGKVRYIYEEKKERKTAVAEPVKQEKKKEKKAPPGSQLPEKIQAKLKELGIGKLPQSDIPANTIETDFSDPENKAVIRWKDDKGRYQSGYTPQFHQKNAAKKWALIGKHRDRLPKVQSELKKKLSSAKPGTTEHEGLLVAAIISETGLRPGSTKSLDGRYGVSTLLGEHVTIQGDKVSFSFVGKQGKENTAELNNPEIAKALGTYKKKGALFSGGSLDAARKAAKEQGLKLKDFRTIIATNKAEKALAAVATPPPLTGDVKKDKRLLAKAMLTASKQVAEVLNNSPAVAAKNYIHPEVFKAWATKTAGAKESLFMEVRK